MANRLNASAEPQEGVSAAPAIPPPRRFLLVRLRRKIVQCLDALGLTARRGMSASAPLTAGGGLRSLFVCDRNGLCGVRFYVGTHHGQAEGTLRLCVFTGGRAGGWSHTAEIDARTLRDNHPHTIQFEPRPDSRDRLYYFDAAADATDGERAVSLYEKVVVLRPPQTWFGRMLHRLWWAPLYALLRQGKNEEKRREEKRRDAADVVAVCVRRAVIRRQ